MGIETGIGVGMGTAAAIVVVVSMGMGMVTVVVIVKAVVAVVIAGAMLGQKEATPKVRGSGLGRLILALRILLKYISTRKRYIT